MTRDGRFNVAYTSDPQGPTNPNVRMQRYSKDGVLFGRVSKATKKGVDGGPEEGDLFSFRFKADKDKLTISDLSVVNVIQDFYAW